MNSVHFAIYLEKCARERGGHLNMTMVQKLLYICYGLWLAIECAQLFEERPKAWKYGPVFPKVHKKQMKFNDSLKKLERKISHESFEKYDELIDVVLNSFGAWSASQLVSWTIREGSAWHMKYVVLEEPYGTMDNLDIINEFETLIPSHKN